MNYFERDLIIRSREFIFSNAQIPGGVFSQPILIVYHGDGDGCTSAYFVKKFLKTPVMLYWVATPYFDFVEAERFALERRPFLAVFLDMPVYNRPAMIQKLTDQGAKVFIYDHHYPGRLPFRQSGNDLLYVNPMTTSGSKAYPTCLFGWELLSENQFFERAVLYMGLYTETWLDQVAPFQEFSPQLQANLKQIARGIHSSFLVEEEGTANRALDFLSKLAETNPSLDLPPCELPEYRALAEGYDFIQNEKISLMKGVEAIMRNQLHLNSIISGVDSRVRLCGLIASDLRWKNPRLVVGIWQKWKDRFICELRRGIESRVNLALLIERINSEIPLLTGGGHPEAAAFAAVESRFFLALRKMRDLLDRDFQE